jgi:hypothetical protein
MKRITNLCQGLYYLVTGVWPLIAVDSFMLVTGLKIDTWLVKMVALLSITNGLALIAASRSGQPALFINYGTAISFLIIDTYYYFKGTISPVYLVDAAIELIFLALLFMSSTAAISHKNNNTHLKQ